MGAVDGCFSPSDASGTQLRQAGDGRLAYWRSKNESSPNANNGRFLSAAKVTPSATTRESKVSNATARWAAERGSPSCAPTQPGKVHAAGEVERLEHPPIFLCERPAPLLRFSLASAMNRPATTRCSSEG